MTYVSNMVVEMSQLQLIATLEQQAAACKEGGGTGQAEGAGAILSWGSLIALQYILWCNINKTKSDNVVEDILIEKNEIPKLSSMDEDKLIWQSLSKFISKQLQRKTMNVGHSCLKLIFMLGNISFWNGNQNHFHYWKKDTQKHILSCL